MKNNSGDRENETGNEGSGSILEDLQLRAKVSLVWSMYTSSHISEENE